MYPPRPPPGRGDHNSGPILAGKNRSPSFVRLPVQGVPGRNKFPLNWHDLAVGDILNLLDQ